MSEVFTPLSAPEAVEAAHRIFTQVDRALSIRRGLTGVQDREIVSIVILARQLDEIARLVADTLPTPDHASFTMTVAEIKRANELRTRLTAAGYLPLPQSPASQETSHGEG